MRVNSFFRAAVLVGLVSVGFSEQATAITATVVTNDTLTVPTTSNGYYVPDFTVGVTHIDYVNTSLANEYRSPWEGTAYANLQYTSVKNGTAGYNISGTSLSFFWGSADPYNTLTFWTGLGGTGTSVSLSGSVLGVPQALGHHLVKILTDEAFRSVTFFSDHAAFEFANLVTPLPAALPLFATGLGVMGWLARRRKLAQPTAAAN